MYLSVSALFLLATTILASKQEVKEVKEEPNSHLLSPPESVVNVIDHKPAVIPPVPDRVVFEETPLKPIPAAYDTPYKPKRRYMQVSRKRKAQPYHPYP